MDELLNEFLTESSENLAKLDLELVDLEKNPENAETLNSIFRTMHTIKGTCGFIGLPRLEKLAHAGENVLVKIRDGALTVNSDVINAVLESIDGVKHIISSLFENGKEPEGDDESIIQKLYTVLDKINDTSTEEESPQQQELNESEPEIMAHPAPVLMADSKDDKRTPQNDETEKSNTVPAQNQTIRVNINTLENLINMVSELVLTRNQLMQIATNDENSALALPLYRLNYVTSELQEQVMKTRMQPIGNAWLKLPRVVRDASKELNKKIELELIGAETELDRQVIELIKDPLTHMIRNAMDHGLETSEERLKLGKPEKGTLRMQAYHAGGHIVIEISDDGRGIPVEKIKEKAVKQGLVSPEQAAALSDSQVFQFIFKSGLSTAEKVTNISVRGVGMDVVRTNIEKIGGNIDIRSKPNKGSTFIIKIPLTLSIVSALIAEVSGYRFAIPQLNILELVHISENSTNKIEYINDRPVLRLRQKLLTLVHMKEILGLANQDSETSADSKHYVIVLQVGTATFGIIVDKVFNTQEIVVKPVSSLIRHLSIFAGNTILGDGGVIMILDPNHIANVLTDTHLSDDEAHSQAIENNESTFDKETFLLFYAQDSTPKAIPLSTLTRLEKINLTQVEYSNGRPCIQYRETLMPLICLYKGQNETNESHKPVLVFSSNQHMLGLVVDEIVDIVEGYMDFKLGSTTEEKLGVTILNGQATDVLNTDYYLRKEFSDWYRTKDSYNLTNKRLVFIGDHFYGANFLIPFLKIQGYHITAIENEEALNNFFGSGHQIDGFILDLESPLVSESIALIQKQDIYIDLPKIVLFERPPADELLLQNLTPISRTDRQAIMDTIHHTLTSNHKEQGVNSHE